MVMYVFSQILHMFFIYGFEFSVRNWEMTLYKNILKFILAIGIILVSS